ncbi:MAG: GLUG motif-containing protein, partial [Rikenellaceae bacterium]
MKKLSAFLLTLILFAFCAKDIAVSPSGQEGSGGGQVCFSASMLSLTESKAADVKKQWQDGDQIAIFVDGDDSTIYAYDINSAGEMSPAEGVAAFEVKDSDLVQATYLAFYPYNANFTTLEEYQTATSTHEDIMSSIASGTSTVEFTFSHDAALLYFNFLVGDAISEATLSTAEQSYVLDFEVEGYQASCSIFVEPIDDISDVMLKIVSGTKSYYYSMAADFASWSVGCSYNYSNLNIGLSTGSGTQEDPFLIYSAENMRKVGTGTDDWSLSAHYKLMCDVDLGGIDNSGAGVAANQWAAIGTSSENFTGTFDGGGYKISGIYINNSTADNQGLFGYINGATIKNLVVAGSVTCNSGVGGVVGRALSSTITNCCNSVEILSGESAVGGVVGYASSSTIAACYNTAKINGAESVGGVVGNLRSSSTLSVSYSSSSVAGQTSWGGVVGNAYASSVASCYWNSDEFSGDGVGNITDSTVSNVVGRTTEAMHFVDFLLQLNDAAYQYNNDTETPSTLACAWIAGSDGYPTLDFSNTNPTETAYSGGDGSEAWPYKIATAEDMRELSAAVAAGTTYYNLYFEMVNDVDLGGIDENGDGIAENEFTAIGNNSNKFRGVFDGCGFMVSGLYINKSSSSNQGLFGCIGYLTGATTIKNLSVAGSVTGLYPVGGVVGYIAISSCIVTGCHNYCSINSASVALSSSTGGVVGNNGIGATITSCSNSGDITSVNYYVGGVVGYNNGGTLTYCHNSGDVIGSYSTGGVVGYAVGGTLTY